MVSISHYAQNSCYTFLCKIGITDSELCTFCNEYPETLNHLFWECAYTSEIWEEIHEWIKELSGIDIYMNRMDIVIGKQYKLML